jgi:plasmid replication initiation protein
LPGNLPAKLVVKSNKLIEAAYKLTLQEQRIILTLVSMIHPDDEDFKDYYLDIKDFIRIAGLTGSSSYSEAKKVTKRLQERVLEIEDIEKKTLLQISWLSSSLYSQTEGYVRLRFDPDLKPFLIGIKNRFTQYALLNAIKLRSVYSIRIYELLKQYEKLGERILLLEELKKTLGLKKEDYEHFGHFRSRVLDSSIKEINTKTDIRVGYEVQKRGRKVHRIIFSINKTEAKKIKSPPEVEEITNPKLYDKLIKYFLQTPTQAKEYLKQYSIEQIHANLLHVERRFKDGKISNLGAYTKKAISEDFRDQRSLFELEKKAREEKLKQEADLKRLQEQRKDDYEDFRRKQIEKAKERLSEEELKDLESIAETEAKNEHGENIGLSIFTRLKFEDMIMKKTGIPSFEEWGKKISI